MKRQKLILPLLCVLVFSLSATLVSAADFDWMRDMNVTAQADPSGFRMRLATRFKIGDADVGLVLGNVERPADAYMVLRLGEMSSRPYRDVLQRYRMTKTKGWGALAHDLGIKPGSAAFHALKNGRDLYGRQDTFKSKGKGKGPGHGKGKK
ncbi:MAG: hypothetical protein C0615_04570 [Desulfuromonas sp.]|nr:MAG: hypothetical protein C0615_04570 [Desulfuromonas sp.]